MLNAIAQLLLGSVPLVVLCLAVLLGPAWLLVGALRGRRPTLRLLCRLGSHYDEPIHITHERAVGGAYVLVRCARCERSFALQGAQALEWLRRHP